MEVSKTYTDKELISLYEERPVLWDNRLKEYHNRDSKTKALNEIAAILKINSSEVKKKLHSLRTSFTNEKRRLEKKKSGQAAEAKKPSQKYEALKFLHPVVTLVIKTQSNMMQNDTDETESTFYTDEFSVDNEFNCNDIDVQTQICEISDEESLANHSNLFCKPAVSENSLPPSKKRRLNQIATAEQENATINAALQYLTKQSCATSDLLNQRLQQSTSAFATSSFATYLDSTMKCLTDVERGELEMDILNFVHSKKKEILEKRDIQPVSVQHVERVSNFHPVQTDPKRRKRNQKPRYPFPIRLTLKKCLKKEK